MLTGEQGSRLTAAGIGIAAILIVLTGWLFPAVNIAADSLSPRLPAVWLMAACALGLALCGVTWAETKAGAKAETVFLTLFPVLALVYCLIMPIGSVPDEPTHLHQAYCLATGQAFSKLQWIPENLDLLQGRGFEVTLGRLWQEGFFEEALSGTLVQQPPLEASALYPQAAYLPQAAMMALTMRFTDRLWLIFYSARIGSAVVTALLFRAAIRLAPVGKKSLLAIACLPVTLQEAASASCDGMTIAGLALTTAVILWLMTKPQEVSRPGKTSLLLLGVAAVVWKLLYLPVLLLAHLIPAQTLGGRKAKRLWLCLMWLSAAAALGLWAAHSILPLIGAGADVDKAVTRSFSLLNAPLAFPLAMLRTVFASAGGWISGTFRLFGWLHLNSGLFLGGLTLLNLITVCLLDDRPVRGNPSGFRPGRFRAVSLAAACVCLTLVCLALYVWYTPEGAEVIRGIQGRYFVPLFPMLMLCLPSLPGFRHREGLRRATVCLMPPISVSIAVCLLACTL